MSACVCKQCGHKKSKTLDVRLRNDPISHVWRRRQCENCGHRFTTYEIEATPDELLGFVIAERNVDEVAEAEMRSIP
ncbi:hypothetical protein [Alterisphingorhabdus coralli]|uniref:NrdR family transcriptional regulator n=1 Tax=Alterisphingorhabdus coralli TaxID=3071408 RepID=UPI003872D950